MKLTLALIVACSTYSGLSVARPLDPPYGFAELPDGLTAVTIPDFRCASFTACPAGVKLIDASTGGLKGCVLNATASTCSGDCQTCTGSTSAVELCEARPTDSCVIGTGTIVSCGTISTMPCIYSALVKLPVKCDCTGIVTTTTSACNVANCI